MNEAPKRTTHEVDFELGVAAVDAVEDLTAQTRPFIESASNFPTEIRNRLSELLTLTPDEIQDITSKTASFYQTVEAKEGMTISRERKRQYLHREIGVRLFNKLHEYLFSALLLGEHPDEVSSTSQSEFKVRYTAQKFVEAVRPILVRDLISKNNEE